MHNFLTNLRAVCLQVLSKLIAREDLSFEEAEQSLDLILESDVPEQIAAFLALLAAKGKFVTARSTLTLGGETVAMHQYMSASARPESLQTPQHVSVQLIQVPIHRAGHSWDL